MKFLFLIAFQASMAFASWDLNDVSYLFPLPETLEQDPLLHVDSPGLGGYLLHPSFLSQVPALTLAMRPEDGVQNLRVVAVRIDPCFPLPTPRSCQHQVRLVWQPISLDRKQKVRAEDAALHSFYILNDSEFLNLLRDISIWKSRNPSQTMHQPLSIHPAWQRLGVKSTALREFQMVLQKHVGMKNFFRVTGVFLRGAGNLWTFANFQLEDGRLRPQPVARLEGKRAQAFVNLAVPSDHFDGGGMSPHPTGPDTLDFLFLQTQNNNSQTEEMIRKSFVSLYRIENPRIYNPENMDCVSCHVTQPVKYAFFNKRPDLNLKSVGLEFQYQNPRYNLANVTVHPGDTQITRAFGYFGTDVVVSQRVINESAEVADWLNYYLR